jgi:hypothetical protein
LAGTDSLHNPRLNTLDKNRFLCFLIGIWVILQEENWVTTLLAIGMIIIVVSALESTRPPALREIHIEFSVLKQLEMLWSNTLEGKVTVGLGLVGLEVDERLATLGADNLRLVTLVIRHLDLLAHPGQRGQGDSVFFFPLFFLHLCEPCGENLSEITSGATLS